MLEFKGLFNKLLPSTQKNRNITFLKQILAGKKRLLKISNSTYFPYVPKVKELKMETIWNSVKNSDDIVVYFPDVFV